MRTQELQVAEGGGSCPFFRPARPDALYRVSGFCTGLSGSVAMIPSIEEYDKWCCTVNYTSCPIYRSRHDEDSMEIWPRIKQEVWGLSPRGA